MRPFSHPCVMVVAIAALLLAAAPVGATGSGPSGCVNITASLNGEGLFIWAGLSDAVGMIVGTGPGNLAAATFGVVVFPDACASGDSVQSLLTNVESRATASTNIPVLP